MPYFDAATYKERERQWRSQAATLSPGPERDACLALADGYANLTAILERMTAPPNNASTPGPAA
jgi:hypothetical protein